MLNVIIEKKVGKYIFVYDGLDLTVHDTEDAQRVVLREELSRDSLQQFVSGITETVRDFNSARRGVRHE